MLAGADEALFRVLYSHARPTYPGGNEEIDPEKAMQPLPARLHISPDAVRGWVPQNHMDCKAAAVASALNTVLGLSRDAPLFFTTHV